MSLPPEYASTVFHLEDPPDPLPPTFAIITAWNPGDERPSADANEAADLALRNDLADSGRVVFRASGFSPDFLHGEPGWGADIPKADAIVLGRKYRQRAIWWIAGSDLILLDCETSDEQRVASFPRRLVS